MEELERELELEELERELEEFELERELDRELDTLELDEINTVLDELTTIFIELVLELDKLEEREDETELISVIELLLEELTAFELTTALLELEITVLDIDVCACDELLDSSSITASPPHAVNKQNKGIQTNALIFTLFFINFFGTSSLKSGTLKFSFEGLFKAFLRKTNPIR